jgi:hypothetical protein
MRIATGLFFFGLLASVGCVAGCISGAQAKASAVDTAVSLAAPHGAGTVGAAAPPPALADYKIFAGDFHTHVAPPDTPPHVMRGLHETVELAKSEGMDFVVLTPHVGARFFTDARQRAWFVTQHAALVHALEAEDKGNVLFVAGCEYTDGAWGHVGMFGDFDRTLADVSAKEANANPARFFERFAANGGMLTINHPLVGPLDSSFEMARVDLSWRMLTEPERSPPPEIRAVDRLASSYEAYNTTATELRDRFLVGDRDKTLRDTLATYDRIIARDHRRITPVGGSDSHGHYVRSTTFVMAKSLDQASLRDAIQNGRACIRSREACTLEARPTGGAFVGVGGAIENADGKIEVRARGRDIEIFLDGERVATPSSDFILPLDVPRDRCVSLRARVGDGYSAPIYVGCGTKEHP